MSNVKIIVNIYSITCLLGPYLMRIILSLSQAWMRIVSIRYGRGDGQQRGQEAAALHDDGGEVQHEVGEAVQPALLHTVSRGAGLGQEPAAKNILLRFGKLLQN